MVAWLRYFAFMVVIWIGTVITIGIVRLYGDYRSTMPSLAGAADLLIVAPIVFLVLSIAALVVIRLIKAIRLPFIAQLIGVAISTAVIGFFVFIFDWLITANDNFYPSQPHNINIFFVFYADHWQYHLSNGLFRLIQYGFVVVYLSVYTASILWAKADADARGKPGWLVAFLVALLQFPIGLLVWLIFRPKKESASPPIQSLPA